MADIYLPSKDSYVVLGQSGLILLSVRCIQRINEAIPLDRDRGSMDLLTPALDAIAKEGNYIGAASTEELNKRYRMALRLLPSLKGDRYDDLAVLSVISALGVCTYSRMNESAAIRGETKNMVMADFAAGVVYLCYEALRMRDKRLAETFLQSIISDIELIRKGQVNKARLTLDDFGPLWQRTDRES